MHPFQQNKNHKLPLHCNPCKDVRGFQARHTQCTHFLCLLENHRGPQCNVLAIGHAANSKQFFCPFFWLLHHWWTVVSPKYLASMAPQHQSRTTSDRNLAPRTTRPTHPVEVWNSNLFFLTQCMANTAPNVFLEILWPNTSTKQDFKIDTHLY